MPTPIYNRTTRLNRVCITQNRLMLLLAFWREENTLVRTTFAEEEMEYR